MRPETKLFFFETPSNPTLEIVDMKAVCDIAHKAGVRVVVDNAFASPALQRPMEFGADIVVHSSTKYIDGQGRALGGVILCKEDFLKDHLQIFLRNTGPCISPFNAWLHLKSLETLDLRMTRTFAQCRQGRRLPERREARSTACSIPFRSDHPQHNTGLARSRCRRGGGVVTFEVAGGKKAAFKVAKALKLVDISNNLGDAKSLLTHPATTTHQRMTPEARLAAGVTDGMLRIAVGLEDAEDLCQDLAQALATI